MVGKLMRLTAALAVAALCLAGLIQGMARLTWRLSGAGTVPLDSLASLPVPDRNPTRAKAVHSVQEWPPDKPRAFSQAPMLDDRVTKGELPPVDQRLPENPLVIVPPDPKQLGPYGGTWTRFGTTPNDVGIVEARIAYEGLVRWNAMGTKILPNLATRWDVADGGKTFTFYLRRGVRWSDGEPFTADDILFWYRDVLKNPEITPSPPNDLKRGGELFELDRVDQYTLRFRFKETHGLFLMHLASGRGYEMLRTPKHYLKQFHINYADPTELKKKLTEEKREFWYQLFASKLDWRNTEQPRLWAWIMKEPPPARPAIFERNPYYWKVDPAGHQLPYIDKLAFHIFDIETINLRAIRGDVGMQGRHMQFKNYSLFMEGQAKGNYRVLHWVNSGGSILNIAPNLNHKDPAVRKLIEKPAFRQALSHAIDRNAINRFVYLGAGVPRQDSPPPTSPFTDEAYANAYVEYDVDQANRMLDEVGLAKRGPDGYRLRPDGQTLVLNVESTQFAGETKALELVATYWRRVGIKSDLKLMARNLYYRRKAALMHDVGAWGASDEQMPLVDPRWFIPFSPESIQAIGYATWFNSGGKTGPEPKGDLRTCIDLYHQIEGTIDPVRQKELFRKIVDLNRKNLWVIGTVGQVPIPIIVSNRFRNVPEVAISGWIFRTPGNTAPECYAIEE